MINTLATCLDLCEVHTKKFFSIFEKKNLNQKLIPQDDITDEI